VWIGVYPKPYFDVLQRPVTEIVERVRPNYSGPAIRNASMPRRDDQGAVAGGAQ
jgi:hypothetical protein